MIIRFVLTGGSRLVPLKSGVFFVLLAAFGIGCGAAPQLADERVHGTELNNQGGITPAVLRTAADRSAGYLINACNADGRFAYRINLDPAVEPDPGYNTVRHAGTMYALGQYCQHAADPRAKAALLRAARFLRGRCVGPVAGNPNFLAVWSDSELIGGDRPRQVKLGGSGLGLVGLLSVERVEPGFTPMDELRKLGRFLIFMQKDDGSFYSKYYPEKGRCDRWHSQYYPGEAALGLLMLYEQDPAQRWLHTATKALEHLAYRGSLQESTFPDHWYLLALQQWFDVAGNQYSTAVQTRLLDHARHLCRDILADQQRQMDVAQLRGCFTSSGRTCPTATRLEGLIAALHYLPQEDEALRRKVRGSVERGLLFLVNCQVIEGPHAGAFPRYKPGFRPRNCSAAVEQRLQEVRIDYVQHALSAILTSQEALLLSHDGKKTASRPEMSGKGRLLTSDNPISE